jgi:hypothetical protein
MLRILAFSGFFFTPAGENGHSREVIYRVCIVCILIIFRMFFKPAVLRNNAPKH